MTKPSPAAARGRRGAPKIRPGQVVAAGVVLAIFVTGLVIGGVAGAGLVGLLTVAAAALLVLRWPVLDYRLRLFRLGAVLAAAAVAVSLLFR